MKNEAVQPGGFFADGSTLWLEDSLAFHRVWSLMDVRPISNWRFDESRATFRINIFEVWRMATLVLGLSRAGCAILTYGQRLARQLLESFEKNGI
jgi:hypothetical protein